MTSDREREAAGAGWANRLCAYGILTWIMATGGFFFLRFTFAFVHANLDAIRGLLGE